METPNKYQWKRGRSHPADAQIVGDAIDAIVETEGRCTPQHLVEKAKPKAHPLHNLFTWDNATAANQWRTYEARNIINSVVVMSSENVDNPPPAFISVGHVGATLEFGEGYRPFSIVMGHPQFQKEALTEAMGRLHAVRRRYESIAELSPVWDAIEEVEVALV